MAEGAGEKEAGATGMTLNKQAGNMYGWVTHTWNPIRGRCPHECAYCYMKRFGWKDPPHLVEKELETDLGRGNTIFVGSSIDMFAKGTPVEWIYRVMDICRKFDKNTYLFQSKNVALLYALTYNFTPDMIAGTTIESNVDWGLSFAPKPYERKNWMQKITKRKMVSIEPIIEFNPDILVPWIKEIEPEFVSIGADSKGHNLPEPSAKKVRQLISELSKFTRVIQKKNLNRILVKEPQG